MAKKTIMILGGYGNTGKLLARLLLSETDAHLVIAGRNVEKAERLVRELNAVFAGDRVQAVCVDASAPASLRLGLAGMDLVVVASSTTQYVRQLSAGAMEAGVDYLDIQYSPEKIGVLRSMEGEIQRAGRCFITDGGFHPGLPGLLVRYVSQYFDKLELARVGSVIKEDWKKLQVGDEAVIELVELVNDFEMLVFKAGKWKKASMLGMGDMLRMDFGGEFGMQYCAPMMLEEMRLLPDIYPTLADTGFYVGSFNWFVDWVVFPVVMLVMKLSPQAGAKPMGSWMHWGLKTFSTPPYGTILRVEAKGLKDGQPITQSAMLSHPDGYMFTAIPVAACLLQYLDGLIDRPGLWWQALVVEPNRFMRDMERMGIAIRMEPWREI